jgi:hypothetical protein
MIISDNKRVSVDRAQIVSLLQELVTSCNNSNAQPGVPSSDQIDGAIDALRSWFVKADARAAAGLRSSAAIRARRRLIRRIDSISVRAPAHRKPQLREMAARARRAATATYPHSTEAVLIELANAAMPDEAWLKAVESFGSAQRTRDDYDAADDIRVEAVLFFGAHDRRGEAAR